MDNPQWIINFGFAAVVAWYTLTRLDKSLKELAQAVTTLGILVANQTDQNYEQTKRLVAGGGE